jgi:signal peptidase II
MEKRSSNAQLFWPVVALVLIVDAITKFVAARSLGPLFMPREVFGDWMRFTLVYNKGAAFGLHVGPYSRWVFLALTLVALYILGRLYQSTRPGDWSRVLAVALVCGGALGNLYDRVRYGLGVVDFIDIGVGDWRWPTFNIADVAVSVGAFLLAWALWGEDQVRATQASPEAASLPAGTPETGD